MIAFEVSVNGKKKCTAGVQGYGVLSACITWVNREHAGPRVKRTELCLGVAGLGSKSETDLEWLSRKLHLQDEVTIRIVDAPKVDVPKKQRRFRATPQQKRRNQERLVRRLAKELGWKIQEGIR